MHAMHALSQLSYSPETGTGFYCVPVRVSREFVGRAPGAKAYFTGGGGATVMVVFVDTPAPAQPLSGMVD
jgi:hypothetical protein